MTNRWLQGPVHAAYNMNGPHKKKSGVNAKHGTTPYI